MQSSDGAGRSMSVTLNNDGTSVENGSQTYVMGGSLHSESWQYNFDANRTMTGGYELENGVKVILGANFAPTGEIASEAGGELSVGSLLEVQNWNLPGSASSQYDAWEIDYLANASDQEKTEFTNLTVAGKNLLFFEDVFDAMLLDFNANEVTEEPILEQSELKGFKFTASEYSYTVSGSIQANYDAMLSEYDVYGGNFHSSTISKNGVLIADGSNAFDLEVFMLGSIMDGLGLLGDEQDNVIETGASPQHNLSADTTYAIIPDNGGFKAVAGTWNSGDKSFTPADGSKDVANLTKDNVEEIYEDTGTTELGMYEPTHVTLVTHIRLKRLSIPISSM